MRARSAVAPEYVTSAAPRETTMRVRRESGARPVASLPPIDSSAPPSRGSLAHFDARSRSSSESCSFDQILRVNRGFFEDMSIW